MEQGYLDYGESTIIEVAHLLIDGMTQCTTKFLDVIKKKNSYNFFSIHTAVYCFQGGGGGVENPT